MTNRLTGKRIALFVEDQFEDRELIEPLNFLREQGAEVVVVGSGRAPQFSGKNGAIVEADASPDDVVVTDFDAFVIPGGYAPDHMRLSARMVTLIAEADDAGKVIAAICHGPQLLISADIMRGRMATSAKSIAVDVKNAGAHFVEDAVVVDGNLITSRGPDDLVQFNQAIADALVTSDKAIRQPMVAGA
jgi:protease I